MQQTSEALRSWFRQVEPICPELFNAAYAMCGNYELAEQAVCGAVLELWAQDITPGMGFRERARAILREECFSIMASPQAEGMEFTWPGIPDPRSNDPILTQASQERLETQRALVLRHGCGLSLRAISSLTGMETGRLRAALDRFEARCRRNLTGQNRSRADQLITQRMQRALLRAGSGAPSAARIYRAFEAEASRTQTATHRLPIILGRALLVLMALVCGVAFWFFAVLVQPAAPSAAPAPTAAVTEAP